MLFSVPYKLVVTTMSLFKEKIIKYLTAPTLLAVVAFSFFGFTSNAQASVTSAYLDSVAKGKVVGNIKSLEKKDGGVSVLLPNSLGQVQADFTFNVSSINSSEPATLVIDVFEQTTGAYTLSLANSAGTKFTKLTRQLRCYTMELCVNTKFVYELPMSLARYVSGNTITLRFVRFRAQEARVLIDAMNIEQASDGLSDPLTPINAVNDRAVTEEGVSVSIPVLDNDKSGAPNSGFYISSIDRVENGTAVISGRNVVFTPKRGFYGDTFHKYTAVDSMGTSNSAIIKVIVVKKTASTSASVSTSSNSSTSSVSASRTGIKSIPSKSTFYWQLQGNVRTHHKVDVYGVDMEDNENTNVIKNLKNRGITVVCYISAGSYEEWRSDKRRFNKVRDLGNPIGSWPGEYYLNIKSSNVRNIMKSRINRAAAAGCDGIEPDNVDAYQASNGLGITMQDQLDYLLFLANYAHSKGLSIGLKNAVGLIQKGKLHKVFDWALNESCYSYNECDLLKPFVAEGKAVFIAMYGKKSVSARCANARARKFHLSFHGTDYKLDGWPYQACK